MWPHMNYNVIEKFLSINGEGMRQGHLCTFIRFKGCNLRCKYCDSAYSYDPTESAEIMTAQQIVDYCKANGSKMVMLAGGEPMFQRGIVDLIKLLCDNDFSVEIETNGSIDISEVAAIENNRPFITLDYKTSASGMEHHNLLTNYKYLTKNDSVKFVVGSLHDLDKMVAIVNEYDLLAKANVLISPVWGGINPAQIIDYMRNNKLNGYKMQMQIHKFIWDAEERGV